MISYTISTYFSLLKSSLIYLFQESTSSPTFRKNENYAFTGNAQGCLISDNLSHHLLNVCGHWKFYVPVRYKYPLIHFEPQLTWPDYSLQLTDSPFHAALLRVRAVTVSSDPMTCYLSEEYYIIRCSLLIVKHIYVSYQL